jgi:hypothetical protein
MVSRTSLSVSIGAAAVIATSFVWVACSSSSSGNGNSPDGGGGGGGGGSSSGAVSGSSSGSASASSSGAAGGSSSGSAGGSSSGTSSGGGTGACPQTACASGSTCCADLTTQSTTCSSSCEAADLVACTGSADCAGSTDGGTECCATAILTNGLDGSTAFPHGCTVQSITSYCGQCTTNVQLGCEALGKTTQTEPVHVCSTPADCASDKNNPLCCPVFSYNICLNDTLAAIGNVTCMDGGT